MILQPAHIGVQSSTCVIEANAFPFNADFNRLTHIRKPSSEQPHISFCLGCKASKMLCSAELLVFVAGLVWQNVGVSSQAVIFLHYQDLGFMINCWNVLCKGFTPLTLTEGLLFCICWKYNYSFLDCQDAFRSTWLCHLLHTMETHPSSTA